MSEPNRRPHRLHAALAAAAAAVLLLAGCDVLGGNSEGKDGGASDAGGTKAIATAPATPALAELGESPSQHLKSDPATDPAYERYYQQKVTWGECTDVKDAAEGLECGTVTVPKVWKDPSQGDLNIAVARTKATGERKGGLLLNPGGPGGSGVDYASIFAESTASPELKAAYDVIGFDPRGVSRSHGIHCLSDEEFGKVYDAPTPPDATAEENLKRSLDFSKKMADGCEKSAGDLIPYLDTYSAARDMDVIRAVVARTDKLDYLGFSYGTYLGATYADLYPARVGHMVLDAAMDPALTLDQIGAGQVAGFEKAFEAYIANCLESAEDCPLRGSVPEAKEQLLQMLETWDGNPLPTNSEEGRRMTGSHAGSALTLGMYDDAMWPYVTMGLRQAAEGDGTMLLKISDLAVEREPGGHFKGNSRFAIQAINCLDHPGVTDEAWQKARSQELEKKYPLMGENAGYGAAFCAQWPMKPVRKPAPISAKGAAPIVVIGTTGDPATPYQWSQSLAKQLDSGVLLTFDGNGHTAYGRSGGCIEEAVDAYLLEDKTPQDGLRCASSGGGQNGQSDGGNGS